MNNSDISIYKILIYIVSIIAAMTLGICLSKVIDNSKTDSSSVLQSLDNNENIEFNDSSIKLVEAYTDHEHSTKNLVYKITNNKREKIFPLAYLGKNITLYQGKKQLSITSENTSKDYIDYGESAEAKINYSLQDLKNTTACLYVGNPVIFKNIE